MYIEDHATDPALAEPGDLSHTELQDAVGEAWHSSAVDKIQK